MTEEIKKLFTTTKQQQLRTILEDIVVKQGNTEITSEELLELANIKDVKWVSKNKSKLEEMGFKIIRKAHKPHSNKGIASRPENNDEYWINYPITDHSTYISNGLPQDTDYLLRYNQLLFKLYINMAYVSYGLVAPFHIQHYETVLKDNLLKTKHYQILKNRVIEANIDVIEELKYVLHYEERAYSSTATTYAENLINSLESLSFVNTSPVLSTMIVKVFKEVFPKLTPSEEQIQAVSKAYEFAMNQGIYKNCVSASIQSDAGSSKSTVARVLQSLLHDLNPIITAITNKCIANLEYKSTIFKLLQTTADIDLIKDDRDVQMLKARRRSNKISFIIVDESSQVGEGVRTLLETIANKVLYIGDIAQLPALHDQKGTDFLYLHSLTTQYRFLSSGSSLQTDYTQFNKMKEYESTKELFNPYVVGFFNTVNKPVKQENGDIIHKTDYTSSFNEYKDLVMSYDKNDSIIIAYAQNAVDALNVYLNGSAEFKIGSKVMLVQNDYDMDQYNGFQYRITHIDNTSNIPLYTCKSIETNLEYVFKAKQLVLAYAITTYKSQGSEWDNVLGIDATFRGALSTDRYILITRARSSFKALTKDKVISNTDTSIQNLDLLGSILSKLDNALPGSRNNTLYMCVKELKDNNLVNEDNLSSLTTIAFESGLDSDEIEATINSALYTHPLPIPSPKSNISNSSSKLSNSLILSDLPINPIMRLESLYTPVFKNKKTLKGSDRTLTYNEALAYDDILYVAEELKHSNRIVIDCDSISTTELFKQYVNKTESYVSDDMSSLHLVFTTNKLIPSKYKKDIDLLGNKLYTLRNIKPNKLYNGLNPIPLTQEILNIFNSI